MHMRDSEMASLLFWFNLFLLVAYLLTIAGRASLGPLATQEPLISSVAVATLLMLLTLSYFRIWIRTVAYITVIAPALVTMYRTFHIGGPESPALITAILVPVVAVFVLGPRAALWAAPLAASMIVLMWVLSWMGHSFGDIGLSRRDMGLLQGVVILFIMGVVTFIAWLYAMRNRQLQEQLRIQADSDYLTGIANRRRFDAELDVAVDAANSGGPAVAVGMIDLDYFKQYNDHFGHRAGDECLVRVTLRLAQVASEIDGLLARYGGEELSLVMRGQNREQVADLMERMRAAVQSLHIPHPLAGHGVVTVSAGASISEPDHHVDADELLRRADKALYQGKRIGRNRAVIDA